eukprot:s4041_g4.t1
MIFPCVSGTLHIAMGTSPAFGARRPTLALAMAMVATNLVVLPTWVGTQRAQRIPRSRIVRRSSASEAVTEEVIRIIKQECPSFSGEVQKSTALATLQSEADSLDTLEAMMELEDHFKVELEDEWMEEVQTVQDLADLIWRTPRGLKLRTVDDETYIAMIRKSHSENRWGELYDGWEKDIPPQYEHRGPSLAEEAQADSKQSSTQMENLENAQSMADSKQSSAQMETTQSMVNQPETTGKVPTPPAAKITKVASLTVPQLRSLLRDLGLDDSGPKAELLQRLGVTSAGVS